MINKLLLGIWLGLFVFLVAIGKSYADQTLLVSKVDQEPVIDGVAHDKIWSLAKPITTHDKVDDIDVVLKAVYSNKKIFFLVTFPDKNESRTHRSWKWNKKEKEYEQWRDREDTFIIKWNMEKHPVDLSIFADHPYRADVWFWKACRTDPVGYADDKTHHLITTQLKKTKEIVSKSGKKMFLQRLGDSGKSSYKSIAKIDYEGDIISRYRNRQPEGSRADIKAKGRWKDGQWTIEFGRALATEHLDDIEFDLNQTYQFGVSRHEIAGREEDPTVDQPKYGSGDISEILTLKFSH